MNLRRRRRTSPVIPIVAMVDILVITLLFIVATTSFRKRKTEVQVNLPTASRIGKDAAQKVVRKSLTGTKDKIFMLDGKEVPEADLVAALKSLKTNSPDAKLELSIDKDAPHGMYVTALDALVASGFVKNTTEMIQKAVEAANPK
jgi:biopolymer transport protein ExbD